MKQMADMLEAVLWFIILAGGFLLWAFYTTPVR